MKKRWDLNLRLREVCLFSGVGAVYVAKQRRVDDVDMSWRWRGRVPRSLSQSRSARSHCLTQTTVWTRLWPSTSHLRCPAWRCTYTVSVLSTSLIEKEHRLFPNDYGIALVLYCRELSCVIMHIGETHAEFFLYFVFTGNDMCCAARFKEFNLI